MALLIDAPDYPIESVTMCKSHRAEVVRRFSLQLAAGQNKIEIKSLPGTIDTKSIRISGLGHARLHDVVCLLNQRKRPGPTDSSEVIKALRKQRQQVEQEKNSLEHEARILADYSKTLKAEHVSPADVAEFLKSYGGHVKSGIDAVARLEERIQELDKKIFKEEDAASSKQGPMSNGELTVVIAAEFEEEVELKLTYIVTNAFWEPTYELHATTENSKPSTTVVLNYRAVISQSTGEDWTDAKLTLSTSDTSMNTTIPELPSIKIRPKPEARQSMWGIPSAYSAPIKTETFVSLRRGSSSAREREREQAMSTEPASFGGGGDGGKYDLMQEEYGSASAPVPGTVVRDSVLSVSYSVQGKSTIPSDGLSHMVSVAQLEFDCQIRYVAVPRVEAVVYLQCEVKNTSDYRLLSGTVGVILDESFVSQTSILDVPAGDTFTCTLGVDPATKITYSRRTTHTDTKRSLNAFSEARRTTSYTVAISITNKHGFPLEDVLVKEAVPMVDVFDPFDGSGGDNSKARVVLKKPLGLAEAKPGEAFMLDGAKATSDAGTSVGTGIMARWAKADGSGGQGDRKSVV